MSSTGVQAHQPPRGDAQGNSVPGASPRLDEILGRAAVGIAQLDKDGRFLLVNDAYCQLVGRSRPELLQSRMQDVTHPDDLPASLDGFISVIETGTPLTIEQRNIRADGEPVWTSNSVSAARDSAGNTEFMVVIAHDIAGRVGLSTALSRTQEDLRVLLDSAAESLYCMDQAGKTTLCNRALLRHLGFSREEEVIGKDLHDLTHHSHPDGSPYPREECPIYRAARSGMDAHGDDEVFFRKDGSSFPVEYWVRPIVRDGRIDGAVCTVVDLTERKQNERRQQMMNQELAHRVKNTLAMVQAIVGQTLRNSPATAQAVEAINERLVALGNAHSAMTRTRWGNASIIDVVEGAIGLHRAQPHRIQVDGSSLELGSKAGLAIALAMHELCTNAAKYGALSNDRGTVSIAWKVTGGAADSHFHMRWKESGGPPVQVPTRKGFGSKLIAQSIALDLAGETKLVFEPDGVLWTLDAPLEGLRQ